MVLEESLANVNVERLVELAAEITEQRVYLVDSCSCFLKVGL